MSLPDPVAVTSGSDQVNLKVMCGICCALNANLPNLLFVGEPNLESADRTLTNIELDRPHSAVCYPVHESTSPLAPHQ